MFQNGSNLLRLLYITLVNQQCKDFGFSLNPSSKHSSSMLRKLILQNNNFQGIEYIHLLFNHVLHILEITVVTSSTQNNIIVYFQYSRAIPVSCQWPIGPQSVSSNNNSFIISQCNNRSRCCYRSPVLYRKSKKSIFAYSWLWLKGYLLWMCSKVTGRVIRAGKVVNFTRSWSIAPERRCWKLCSRKHVKQLTNKTLQITLDDTAHSTIFWGFVPLLYHEWRQKQIEFCL